LGKIAETSPRLPFCGAAACGNVSVVLAALRARNDVRFFGVLFAAQRGLAAAWWVVLVLRGVLPALFAVAMGVLVGAVQQRTELGPALVVVGVTFVLLQVLTPIHQALSKNLGSRTAAWLYDQLTIACVRPPGMGHLEHPELARDLSMARDFDLGMTGPPLAVAMDFIASGLVEMFGGLSSAAVLLGYSFWAAPLLAGAWFATQVLLRESAVWHDRNTDEVRGAQRHADYAYRLAVDAPAAKELRLFGLEDWVIGRFTQHRRRLYELQWIATRLRERSVLLSLLLVVSANVIVFWSLAGNAMSGALPLAQVVTFASVALSTNMIAFGGLSWALDGAAAPVAAVLRLHAAMDAAGALHSGARTAAGMPARELRFRKVTFAYPGATEPVLDDFELTIPAGSSLAIVGQNGAGKTTLAKLLCRLYEPQSGAIEVDGVELRELDLDAWRSRIAAVFQDFIRFELPLRENVAPSGAPDEIVLEALREAGSAEIAGLDTILARGYEGGTELSGGQWQRIALARALCAVRQGAGLVLLDEPTAQLDVRGEAEIFDRILAATRNTTTILISHRFSTVRHADRICVLEAGKVVELGSHDELMAKRGRYHTMFELQASRFAAGTDEDGVAYDVLG
jgi:ABC-type multidrug transport system fused ATPase/permease subunit